MASSRKSSLVSRAGAAARKVVGRAVGADQGDDAEVPQETPAKKAPAAKKSPARKTAPTAEKAPAKKTAPTAEKAPAKKAPAKKAPAKKAPAKKSAGAAKKSPPAGKNKPGTSPAPKSTTPTTRPVKTSPAAAKATQKATTSTPVSTQDIAQQAPAKKTAATTPAKKARTTQTAAQLAPQLVVLEHEDPWTTQELEEVRAQLTSDVARLTGELREVEGDLAGMIENPGDGSGHDQADIGSASFERDQERQIVNNARDMLEQSQHALERIDDGSYGQCEIGGEPIGKNRLMAFPRATLCLTCKQREERR